MRTLRYLIFTVVVLLPLVLLACQPPSTPAQDQQPKKPQPAATSDGTTPADIVQRQRDADAYRILGENTLAREKDEQAVQVQAERVAAAVVAAQEAATAAGAFLPPPWNLIVTGIAGVAGGVVTERYRKRGKQ